MIYECKSSILFCVKLFVNLNFFILNSQVSLNKNSSLKSKCYKKQFNHNKISCGYLDVQKHKKKFNYQ